MPEEHAITFTSTEQSMAKVFFVQYGAQFASGAEVHPQLVWQPAVDLYRCTAGWLLKFELAGVHEEDVHVAANSRGITVSGIRRDFRQFESRETHLMEIAYSRFERVVALPEAIEDAQLHAELRDGMLFVRVLTAEQHASR